MKVILRADIDNVGRLGQEVEVKPGFGRNYLIPKGLAMPFSDANRKVFEQEKRKLQAKMDKVKAAAQTVADKLAGKEVFIRVRVGEGDKLYGSVTSQQIVDALAEMGVEELDKKKLVLPESIRSLGRHEVTLRLHHDVQAEIPVIVVPHHWKDGDPIPGAAEEGSEDVQETKSAEPDETGQPTDQTE